MRRKALVARGHAGRRPGRRSYELTWVRQRRLAGDWATWLSSRPRLPRSSSLRGDQPADRRYVTGLHRRLPAALADEAADGLVKTYEDHLTSGLGTGGRVLRWSSSGIWRWWVSRPVRPGRKPPGCCWPPAPSPAPSWSWRPPRPAGTTTSGPGLPPPPVPSPRPGCLGRHSRSTAAPVLTLALGIAADASLGRIAITAWTLPRLAAR